MNITHFLVIILVVNEFKFVINVDEKGRCANVKTSLSVLRKKRHLTFPEGTAMVVSNVILPKSFII